MQKTQVWSLGRECPLEKGMATHSSILAGKSQGQKSLVGYSGWDCKRVGHNLWTKQQQQQSSYSAKFYPIFHIRNLKPRMI